MHEGNAAVEAQGQLTWQDHARWNLWYRFQGLYTRMMLAVSVPLCLLVLPIAFGAPNKGERLVPLFRLTAPTPPA